ncbi:MAG TPA: SGNH/GDSL hydrolase family protein [Solirubrobacteraceae bacterium]|jgi:lysophospholipase L1-like esterase
MVAGARMPVSFRSRSRLIGCLLSLVVALSALLLAPPTGASASRTTYLALGDSLAFGYSQAKFNSLFPNENPAAYNTGYVDDFGKALALFQPGVQTVNDGCPGETTDSFIKGPCQYQLSFPLHHPYSGGIASSQLSDALNYLGAHPGTTTPITLDIGANDALGVIEGVCKLEPTCIAEHAPALFAHIGTNLGSILAQLRGAAPHARIIVLGLYNPFGANIAGADQLTAQLNTVMAGDAAAVHARFVDPLPVFNPPGPLEQPTLCLLTNICTSLKDIHPTDVGYGVLGGLVLQQYLSF